MLQAVEKLRIGTKLANQEHVVTQQRTDYLMGELQRERDLKVVADGMCTGLATKVSQHQEEVQHLEAEVTRQHDEVRKLLADVNGKSLVSLVAFLPGIHGKPFDMVGM